MDNQQIQHYFMEHFLTNDSNIYSAIKGTNEAFIKARLAIYTDGTRMNLIEVLANDFPVLASLMGQDLFTEVMHQYLECYPSRHYSAFHIADHIVDFLKEHAAVAERLDWQEIAHFERILDTLMISASCPTVSVAALQAIESEQWPSMTFAFHPSVQWFMYDYNVADYWQAWIDKRPLDTLERSAHAVPWIFWQSPGGEVCFRAYKMPQLQMLQALQANKTFGDVCEQLATTMDESLVANYALETLLNWLHAPMISAINS